MLFVGAVSSSGIAQAASESDIAEFDRLYDDELRAVAATASSSDDHALSKKLLSESSRYRSQTGMLELMAVRAFKLSAKDPVDLAQANKCIDLLNRYLPDRRLEWMLLQLKLRERVILRLQGDAKEKARQSLVATYESVGEQMETEGEFFKARIHYRRAVNLAIRHDDATTKRLWGRIDKLTFRQRTYEKLKRLLAQLERNPDDHQAGRAIVDLYIVELNDPKSATAYARLFSGRKKRNVELADTPSSKLGDEDAWELANWYQAYADRALEMYRPPLLAKARDLFKRFLRSPDKGDIRVSLAQASLEKVDQQIRELPQASGARLATSKHHPKDDRPNSNEQPDENAITIEAERADLVSQPFDLHRDREASGGVFGSVAHRDIPQNEQMSKPSRGRIIFYVNMPRKSVVEISGRVRSLPNSVNSFFVSVSPGRNADAKMRSWVFNTSPNKWQWAPYGKMTLDQGVNTIVIAGREAGAGIDAIRITPRD